MNKEKTIIFLQTILNFIALDRIFLRWIPNYWISDGLPGLLVSLIVWFAILILSYAIAVRFNNK